MTATKTPSIKTTKSGAPKLRRALTAFNLYTTFLRQKILQGTHQDGIAATVEDVRKISLQHKHKTKRVHRKTHGKHTFQELSRIIAAGWKELPYDQKVVFEDQARIEKMERDQKIASMMKEQREEQKKLKLSLPQQTMEDITSSEEESSCSSTKSSSSASSCASEEWNVSNIVPSANVSGNEQYQEPKTPGMGFDDSFFHMSKEDESLLAILEETIMNDSDDDVDDNDADLGMKKFDMPQTSALDHWEAFTNSRLCSVDSLFTSLDTFEVEAIM